MLVTKPTKHINNKTKRKVLACNHKDQDEMNNHSKPVKSLALDIITYPPLADNGQVCRSRKSPSILSCIIADMLS